jgi:hypothetical protein
LLTERYEFTPYGQRTVYSRNWSIGDVNFDGVVNSGDGDVWVAVYENPPADQ